MSSQPNMDKDHDAAPNQKDGPSSVAGPTASRTAATNSNTSSLGDNHTSAGMTSSAASKMSPSRLVASNERAVYSVKVGKYVRNCIFLNWEDCQPHVEHFSEAIYAAFPKMDHAENFLKFKHMGFAKQYAEEHGIISSGLASTTESSVAEISRSSTSDHTTQTTAVGTSTTPRGRNGEYDSTNGSADSMTESFVKADVISASNESKTNTTDRRTPAVPTRGKNRGGSTSAGKNATTNWTKESYHQYPPSSQWWSVYFFLFDFKMKHNSLTLDKDKVQKSWDTNPPKFSIQEFWKWCDTHCIGYEKLSSDQRSQSVKVKRLTDLGFDFSRQYIAPEDKQDEEEEEEEEEEGEQQQEQIGKPQFESQPPAKRQKKERLTAQARWESMYQKAIAFREQKGNFDIPNDTTDEEEVNLRKWIKEQRLSYHGVQEGKKIGIRNKFLTDARIKKLKSLRFPFEGKSATDNERLRTRKPHPKWLKMLQRLEEYYKENHTFDIEVPKVIQGREVSQEGKAKGELRQWLREQDLQYANMREGKKTTMTEEKVQLLFSIGYKLHYITFAENFEKLKAYVEENGTREIPSSHPLSKWARKVKGQMQRLEEGKQGVKLTEEQAKQLKDLGFVPGNIRSPVDEEEEDRKWNEMYEKLKAYKEKHGDCLISTSNFTDPLVKWVMAQRRYYRTIERSGKSAFLTASRLQKLHAIGFAFRQKGDGYKSFGERVEELKAFKEQHGHMRVPTTQPGTGAFVAHARDQYRLAKKGKKHTMSEEKFKILSDLGFEFRVGKTPNRASQKHTWEERYQQLLEYKEKYGDTIVPQHFTGFQNLGQWVKRQRDNYKLLRKGSRSGMMLDQALRLNEIGFVWDANAQKRKRNSPRDNDEESGDEEEEEGPRSPLLSREKMSNNRLSGSISQDNEEFSEDGDDDPPRQLYHMQYPNIRWC